MTSKSKKDEEDASKSYTSPISSFVNGLKKDILQDRNMISYPESSIFVEDNNKYKLTTLFTEEQI